jgi:hypothetical protein
MHELNTGFFIFDGVVAMNAQILVQTRLTLGSGDGRHFHRAQLRYLAAWGLGHRRAEMTS